MLSSFKTQNYGKIFRIENVNLKISAKSPIVDRKVETTAGKPEFRQKTYNLGINSEAQRET